MIGIDASPVATYLIGMSDVVTRAEQLLVNGPAGLYCPAGDFYIDPVRPVDRAVITHGHADHALDHGSRCRDPENLSVFSAVTEPIETNSLLKLTDLSDWRLPLGKPRLSVVV